MMNMKMSTRSTTNGAIYLVLVATQLLSSAGDCSNNSNQMHRVHSVAAFHNVNIPHRLKHQREFDFDFDQPSTARRRPSPLTVLSLTPFDSSSQHLARSNDYGDNNVDEIHIDNINKRGVIEIGGDRTRKVGERRRGRRVKRKQPKERNELTLDVFHMNVLKKAKECGEFSSLQSQKQTQDSGKLQQIQNRRIFVSSTLLSTSLATANFAFPQTSHANEITWSQSPVNKRNGVTLNQAENTYNLKFITYLSRFLLSFDKECQQWWNARSKLATSSFSSLLEEDQKQRDAVLAKQFGSFAASVEIGLQEYEGKDGALTLMKLLLDRYGLVSVDESLWTPPPSSQQQEVEKFKDNIKEARRQIALLFSLLDVPYQPVEEITKLLASIDNASIKSVSIVKHGGG